MIALAVLLSAGAIAAVQTPGAEIRRRHRQGLSPAHRGARPRGAAVAILFVALYFVVAQLLPLLMLGWASLLPYLQTPSAAALRQPCRSRNFTNLPQALVLARRHQHRDPDGAGADHHPDR